MLAMKSFWNVIAAPHIYKLHATENHPLSISYISS